MKRHEAFYHRACLSAKTSRSIFIKEFGVPDFTVSIGCSGGSYGSAQPVDASPGLYDGILIACTFPGRLSIATSDLDGHLLTHYFSVRAPHTFTESQQVAISAPYLEGREFRRVLSELALRATLPQGTVDTAMLPAATKTDLRSSGQYEHRNPSA